MKDLKIYLIIASALFVVYLVAQYNKPKPTDWTPTLYDNDKIPFGTYILYNQLSDIFPGATVKTYREPVYNVINDDSVNNGSYIIICNVLELNKYDYKKLTQYVFKGNDVFIAASSFGPEIMKQLGVATSAEFGRSSATRLKFLSTPLRDNAYDVDMNCGDGYFSAFDTAKTIVLGDNELHHANFLKFKIGKGSLYLNANPLMFSNYSLLQNMGGAYASITLSYVKNDKNLLWDEYYTQGRDQVESPMRVFLTNYALRWAFYIAFFSLVIFVLYELKRRQRIIPIIAPLNNTTVDFAKVVGLVYFEQRNNVNIAQKKATYFLEHLRAKYYIKTNVLDSGFIETLAGKSGVQTSLIIKLVTQITQIRNAKQVNDNELINLNQNIEQFYIQTN
jgi:hypothetical protein